MADRTVEPTEGGVLRATPADGRLLAEAALEVPIDLYGGDSWPGQDIPPPPGLANEQEPRRLAAKLVPSGDHDLQKTTAEARWMFLKYQVFIDHGMTSHTWEDMRSPLPLGLQYAYDLVERSTPFWWPENAPPRRLINWRAYLATVREVARLLARETPDMLRMEVEGVDELELAHAAVGAATARAQLAVAHSLLTSTDEEELPLRQAPDENANVSFGVMTNEARARMVKEYVLYRLRHKETFTFRGLHAPLSSAWEIARFVCERQIVLHKYQKCTWGSLVTALHGIVGLLTSEEMRDPGPETATAMCMHVVQLAMSCLGDLTGEAPVADSQPSPRDVEALREKMYSLLKVVGGEERAQLSEQLYKESADRKTQEAEASKARGDPEEVYGQLFREAAFLAYFGDNVLLYLQELGASPFLLTQLFHQAMEVTQVFRDSFATKGLPSAELEATLRLAANRVALHAPTAKRMVADDRPTDFKGRMTREVTTLINSDEGMGAKARVRLLAWAKNTIVPEWMANANAAAARASISASYVRAGADERMLGRLDDAIEAKRSFKGPFQTFRDTGERKASYTLSPVSVEKRVWLTKGNVIQGYVAEYNDGYLGFGRAFMEDLPNGSKGHASFESRSGIGLTEAELFERCAAQNLVSVADNEILRTLLTPIMGGSDVALSGLWFYSFLEHEGMLMFLLDSTANGLLVRRLRRKGGDDVFVPIAAVFPAIQAVIYSGGDANALNRDSKYGGVSPHRDEPDMRVHVDKVDFYTSNRHTDILVIWQRMEYLEWSFLTTSGAVQDRHSDPGYRVPVVIADCLLGAYCHFMPTEKMDAQVAPARVSRTLVSLIRPDEEGYSLILPGFKKAVLDGKIVCELYVDMLKSVPNGDEHEMFCTVRWLDSPPTLSGTEYALTILPGADPTPRDMDAEYGAEVSTGEELRKVTWVPGFDVICVMKEGLDQDLYDWFKGTRGSVDMGNVALMHNDNFIPGKQPADKSKCDPRVKLAIARWDKDHDERRGLEWWRHMERERLKHNCPRSAWMKAWGEYIMEEVEEQALQAKKKKDRDERAQKEAKRKALEEKAKKEQRDQQAAQQRGEKLARERALAAQREEEEWRNRASAQGDLGVETMLKEEAEREVLLWKRAALKLAEELNKKWDEVILEQVKEKKNQDAQDRTTERNKAGQDAANARRAAREEKERKAREEKEHKAEEAAARKAAFQAEKAERAKAKAQGAAANAYQDEAKGNKGNKAKR
jgi:hypothetical protein